MAFRPGSNATSPAPSTHGGLPDGKNRWVNVTWMPHASLSQASHVAIMVRAVLASLDELTHFQPEEWQVQVTMHGIAGLQLTPVPSSTRSVPLTSMRMEAKEETEDPLDVDWIPQVSNMTHMCNLQSLLSIPIRWRDLPRDAYLKFVVLVHNQEVVSGLQILTWVLERAGSCLRLRDCLTKQRSCCLYLVMQLCTAL